MPLNLVLDVNLLRDLSSIFSRSAAISWLKGDFTSLNTKIERYSKYIPISKNYSYLDFIKFSYSIIENHYQNEYVYKNAFITDWLIKELGQSDTTIFNEFRVRNSVADLAMFNGTSKAFEIKTAFDSDKRLRGQINDYLKIFNEVYLIIPFSKVDLYKKYDLNIGIILFDNKNERRFEIYRKAKNTHDLESSVIMETLNTNEYKRIVLKYYKEFPKTTSFNQYEICSNLIKEIPINELNKLFIEQIKSRELDNILSDRYYKELNQIFLSLKLKKKDKFSLIDNLKQPIHN